MPNISLTASQVKEARRRAWLGEEFTSIAEDLVATYDPVREAIRGLTWSSIKEPPPVPADYRPIEFRICINPYCGDLYDGYPHGGLCQACYSYARRNEGEMRGSRDMPTGRPPMDLGDLDALYRRYQRGESTDEIAVDLPCTARTLRYRFHVEGYELRENVTRVLTEAEVIQARMMYWEDETPVSQIAEYLQQNYLTVLDAVNWETWRTAGGPMPKTIGKNEELNQCEICGVLTGQTICRYCRQELKQAA